MQHKRIYKEKGMERFFGDAGKLQRVEKLTHIKTPENTSFDLKRAHIVASILQYW